MGWLLSGWKMNEQRGKQEQEQEQEQEKGMAWVQLIPSNLNGLLFFHPPHDTLQTTQMEGVVGRNQDSTIAQYKGNSILQHSSSSGGGGTQLSISPLLFPSRRRRRALIISLFFFSAFPSNVFAEHSLELLLVRYTDSNQGFTLLRPSSWVKVPKAGATVLFEDLNDNGPNNVGVVVTPVRLTTLPDFGTPHFVAHKLIQAEKRKESTKDAAVVGVAERSGEGGLQVYEFEYTVDSTRGGMKRVFSAAFVASKKLYILNISHSDKPESPLDSQRRMMLEQVLHSFDVAPS